MRRLGRWLMDGVAWLVLLYLFLPIFVIVLYSFNKPAGKFNFVWKSFSLEAWSNPFAYEALYESMKLSLRVAALSTLVATIFGTLIALALTRYKFRGASAVNLLLVLPLTTPEVVTQVAMAVPLYLLYEISIAIARYWDWKDRKAEAAAAR